MTAVLCAVSHIVDGFADMCEEKIVNIKISGFPSYWKKGCLQATLLVSLMLVFGTKLYYELSLLPIIQAMEFWGSGLLGIVYISLLTPFIENK